MALVALGLLALGLMAFGHQSAHADTVGTSTSLTSSPNPSAYG